MIGTGDRPGDRGHAGTAGDSQSGMAGGPPGCGLGAAPDRRADAGAARDRERIPQLAAEVPLTGFGAHTIYLWATDAAGNTTATPPRSRWW